jgi:poly(beta-D-mannuronate) lyase
MMMITRTVYSSFTAFVLHHSKRSLSSTFKVCLFLLILSFSERLSATTITVSSLPDLQRAINNAAPGDVIILVDGVYTASSDITVTKTGTASQPITIAAQTIGGAEITGTAGFNLSSPAAYIIIRGFKFTHTASKAKMDSGTSFCRWTRNIFQTPGDGEYLTISGSDHQVDYNTFQHKNAMGRFIAVRGTASQIAQRLWIHHNYFFDFPFQGGANGAEPFQFGLSKFSLSSSNSVVEYNLFEQCHGENELLSVKSSAVTVRYNTIRNCPAQFTLRHGNRCLVYGNYFINTPGIRIFGDDHIIYSNHFENCKPAINIGNGGAEVADGAPLTSHDRPDRVLIAFNTLVNNAQNITQGARANGLGATYITVANNIIQGGGAAATIVGPYTNPQWQGNIIFNTNGAGDMPAESYRITDPLLIRDASGAFHLRTGSPAIDSAAGSYPQIAADMDGQPRTSPLDVGADELSNGVVIDKILNPGDVGHQAVASM